jgi:glycosyltransferase involved in cell wall biosynthesis
MSHEDGAPIPIIAFDDNTWVGPWMNRQELLSRLAARGWPVVYSNGPLSIWERKKPRWGMNGLRSKLVHIDDVTVDYPGRLAPRWQSRPAWDRLVMQHHARRLRKATGENFVLWLFNPRHHEQVSYLQPNFVMFHVRDYYPGFGNWTRSDQHDLDALTERADLITLAGEAMGECLPASARGRARLLENAVDARAYIAGIDEACPTDLAEIAKPRIGLIGAINPKVDLPSLLKLSKTRRDLQLVFIGPVLLPEEPGTGSQLEIWHECSRQSNIHWLGLKDHRLLPAYMAHMDVNVMAYRMTKVEKNWIHYINPLKMHACLAAGKPVIGIDIPAIRRFADHVEIVSEPDGWEASIDNAMATNGNGTKSDRQAVALDNTWDRRVDDLEAWILDFLPGGKAG